MRQDHCIKLVSVLSRKEAKDRVKTCLCYEERHDHTWKKVAMLALLHLTGFRVTTRISAYADQQNTHP